MTAKEHYTSEFFAGQALGSLASARVVLSELFNVFRPNSFVDIGCGVGTWCRAAADLGVSKVLGVDGGYVLEGNLLIEADQFRSLDLENERVSTLSIGKFDLASCLEVAEHLSYDRADTIVEDLTLLSDVILFSAAIPFQGGENHINEQWPEYWGILFKKRGFVCVDFLRPLIWGRTDVEWWYQQNMLVFVRAQAVPHNLFCQATSGSCYSTLSIVHPSNYLSQVVTWFNTYRFAAADEEHRDYRSLVDSYSRGGSQLPTMLAVERANQFPGAEDVFPRTRTERFMPEDLIVQLRQQNASVSDQLSAARKRIDELQMEISTRIDAFQEQARVALIEKSAAVKREFETQLVRLRESLQAEIASVLEERRKFDALRKGTEILQARLLTLGMSHTELELKAMNLESRLLLGENLSEERVIALETRDISGFLRKVISFRFVLIRIVRGLRSLRSQLGKMV